MKKEIKKLESDLANLAKKVKGLKGKVFLVFHDDADGVCSAAIVKLCLESCKIDSDLVCLEKLYPEAIDLLCKKKVSLFFVDIASPHAALIAKKAEKEVFVLDHHQATKFLTKLLTNINPHFYGFDGGKECSASTLCFLFAKNFLGGKEIEKAAELAQIGTAGDLQKVTGLNALPVKVTKAKGAEGKARKLTLLASTGYYRKGPEKAVQAALTEFSKERLGELKELEATRKERFEKAIKELKIKRTKYFAYFDTRKIFADLGVKVIGTFCSYLAFQSFRFKIWQPLLGFMEMSREIPGLGKLKHDYIKVSARTPKAVKSKINLGLLLQKACSEFGGIGEGHEAAASGIIVKGKEKAFLRRVDEIAEAEKT